MRLVQDSFVGLICSRAPFLTGPFARNTQVSWLTTAHNGEDNGKGHEYQHGHTYKTHGQHATMKRSIKPLCYHSIKNKLDSPQFSPTTKTTRKTIPACLPVPTTKRPSSELSRQDQSVCLRVWHWLLQDMVERVGRVASSEFLFSSSNMTTFEAQKAKHPASTAATRQGWDSSALSFS